MALQGAPSTDTVTTGVETFAARLDRHISMPDAASSITVRIMENVRYTLLRSFGDLIVAVRRSNRRKNQVFRKKKPALRQERVFIRVAYDASCHVARGRLELPTSGL